MIVRIRFVAKNSLSVLTEKLAAKSVSETSLCRVEP